MNINLTRRQALATAGLMAAGASTRAFAQQGTTIRQGYQTNMWGMPTYYLMRSGALEKRGLKFEEFAVPSGNLTMQQMVARQVDLGTYAGPSLHHSATTKAASSALCDRICRPHRGMMSRKDLDITKFGDSRA